MHFLEPSHCGCGFMSVERVYALLGTSELNQRHRNTLHDDQQQFIFPSITFKCSGEVVKWIVGVKLESEESNDLEIQIWRPLEGDSRYKKKNATLVRIASEKENCVHEIAVDPPLPFQPGDVLGILQPDGSELELAYDDSEDSVFYYTESTHWAVQHFIIDNNVEIQRGLPLVTVEIRKFALP